MKKWVLLVVVLLLLLIAGLEPSAHAQAAGLSVTWVEGASNGNNDEAGFKVERKLGTTGTFTQVGTTGANILTYPDPNLAFSQQYCYRVRAYNTAGDSGYSPEVCGTTKANPIPSAPTGVTVTPLP